MSSIPLALRHIKCRPAGRHTGSVWRLARIARTQLEGNSSGPDLLGERGLEARRPGPYSQGRDQRLAYGLGYRPLCSARERHPPSRPNAPACASCHGPEAKGEGTFPRLAGQLHDCVLTKLVNWSRERGQDSAKPDTSVIMEPIVHGLTEQQIAAVAAYLSHLE